jgi:hypothetical protein
MKHVTRPVEGERIKYISRVVSKLPCPVFFSFFFFAFSLYVKLEDVSPVLMACSITLLEMNLSDTRSLPTATGVSFRAIQTDRLCTFQTSASPSDNLPRRTRAKNKSNRESVFCITTS